MSQGPEFCTCNPCWYTRNSFFSVMPFKCPWELNSTPRNPYWYTRNFCILSLMRSIRPRDQNSALCNPCWYTRKFLFSLMHSICPRELNSAPCIPWCPPRICYFQFDAFHMSNGPEFCTLHPLLVHEEFFFSVMPSICRKQLNSTPCNPCSYTRNFLFLV